MEKKVLMILATRMQNLSALSTIYMVSISIIFIDQGILTCDILIDIHGLGCRDCDIGFAYVGVEQP